MDYRIFTASLNIGTAQGKNVYYVNIDVPSGYFQVVGAEGIKQRMDAAKGSITYTLEGKTLQQRAILDFTNDDRRTITFTSERGDRGFMDLTRGISCGDIENSSYNYEYKLDTDTLLTNKSVVHLKYREYPTGTAFPDHRLAARIE